MSMWPSMIEVHAMKLTVQKLYREMLSLNLHNLQSEGFFFLWVTGREIDVGRQWWKKWGDQHMEELIWCMTNQLGRTICTGRTGHWLNHSKEHVLMG